MEHPETHIDYDLAAKYLAGECSAEEQARFEAWLSEDDLHAKEFETLQSIWSHSNEPVLDIDVDSAWNKVSPISNEIIEHPAAQETTSRNSWTVIRMAAAVVVLVGLSLTIWNVISGSGTTTYTAEQLSELSLADGSLITLQPGATLTYTNDFAENRHLEFSGQAYFDVASDDAHPFTIQTNAGMITVVGTAFQVSTNLESSALLVEVEEGLVSVASAKDAASAVRVAAGYSCTIASKGEEPAVEETIDVAPFFWKDKTIRFKRTELSKVVETLHELLHIDIRLEGENLGQCELTVTFTNETPDNMLEIIAMTLNLEFHRDGDTFVLSGEGC